MIRRGLRAADLCFDGALHSWGWATQTPVSVGGAGRLLEWENCPVYCENACGTCGMSQLVVNCWDAV